MSEPTEFRNTALEDQVKKFLAGGKPAESEEHPAEEKPAEPALQSTAEKAATAGGKESGIAKTRHSPFAFATLKKQPPSVQKNTDRSKMLGQLLDDAPGWVSEQALGLCALWKEISASDEGSATRVLFEEQADVVIKKLVSFLEGKEVDGDLSNDEKARLARSSALYYASVIWSAKEEEGVPDDEIWRALWFLLKTGAARITRSFPQGAEHIQALPGTWIEFPHAFLDAPTTDGRALEQSGLIEVSGAVINLIKKNFADFLKRKESAQKSATIRSLAGFYEAPCAGIFVVQAPPLYRKEAEQFLGGGLLVVKVAGREDAGFHVNIIEVIDEYHLATFDRSSRMKDVVLRAKFVSLSSGFNAVLRGERLPSFHLPLEVFGKKELNEKEMNPAPRRDDVDKFRVLSHIARVLKRAIRWSLRPAPPTGVRGGEKEKPEQKEGGAGSTPRREHAQGDGRTGAAEKHGSAESKGHDKEVSREAVEDLNGALVQASEKYHLPIVRGMAEFFSLKRPRGVALVFFPSLLYVEKGREPFQNVACVLVRYKDGANAKICAFPHHLAELFSGKYDELVLMKIAAYARWLYKEKHGEKQALTVEEGAEEASPAPVVPIASQTADTALQDQKHKEDPLPKVHLFAIGAWASPQARALAEKFGIAGEAIPVKRGSKATKADVEAYHRSKTVEG